MGTIWLAHYKCGCMEQAERKSRLLGYCGKHGGNATEIIKIKTDKNGKPIEGKKVK